MQDTTIFILARFSSDSDPSEGAQHFVSARPGHQPQHPLWNSQGPTEWPLDPSGQWESLQHGLQPATSAGLSHSAALSRSLCRSYGRFRFWVPPFDVEEGQRRGLFLPPLSLIRAIAALRMDFAFVEVKLLASSGEGRRHRGAADPTWRRQTRGSDGPTEAVQRRGQACHRLIQVSANVHTCTQWCLHARHKYPRWRLVNWPIFQDLSRLWAAACVFTWPTHLVFPNVPLFLLSPCKTAAMLLLRFLDLIK